MIQEKTVVIPVKGMFCPHCEELMQDSLTALCTGEGRELHVQLLDGDDPQLDRNERLKKIF